MKRAPPPPPPPPGGGGSGASLSRARAPSRRASDRLSAPLGARCSLLRRDVVGADHLAPELELALEQGARGFRRLLVGRKQLHAAVFERLADLGIGERVAQRGIEPIDDRPRR